jgi:hypothetical protein
VLITPRVPPRLGARRLDLLTGATVGPRAVLAPRDALVLAWDNPASGAGP